MDEPSAERKASTSREGGWVPASSVELLRNTVVRYLAGEREMSREVARLATSLAATAREQGQTPERLLIAIRALWGEIGLSQGDRLQAASLYDHLVRQTIESYYAE